jgi:hypothetical protein
VLSTGGTLFKPKTGTGDEFDDPDGTGAGVRAVAEMQMTTVPIRMTTWGDTRNGEFNKSVEWRDPLPRYHDLHTPPIYSRPPSHRVDEG